MPVLLMLFLTLACLPNEWPAPGWFDSPLAAGWVADAVLNQSIVDHTVARRWGRSEDLPGAFLFLASRSAGYITGSVISVDGRYLLA